MKRFLYTHQKHCSLKKIGFSVAIPGAQKAHWIRLKTNKHINKVKQVKTLG